MALQTLAFPEVSEASGRESLIVTEPLVLNSPWSGVQSFGAAPSASVLAAVSPPLLGGFLGPSPGATVAVQPQGDTQARLNAGLGAMLARNPVNVPGALGGRSGR
jgi:hypothetical protein